MESLLKALKAVAEPTRIRLLAILADGEYNVTELTSILSQSQPRVSRHLKLMVDAGLIERHKEGNWVLFRLARGDLAADILKHVAGADPMIVRDRERLAAIKAKRREAAEAYFSKVASSWSAVRSLHIDEKAVEVALGTLIGDTPVGRLVDLGTGTGRMLELFAPNASEAVGIDANREMLALARVAIERKGLANAQVRLADVTALPLPDRASDLVIVHQVLHFLDNPFEAISEARRVLAPKGRLVVVDLGPHEREFLREEHAHRRLGIGHDAMQRWLDRAGLELLRHETLPATDADGLDVNLWMARRPEAAHV
jgi:ubiquinone/menaquinone biosynthesis C-methylase UbiE